MFRESEMISIGFSSTNIVEMHQYPVLVVTLTNKRDTLAKTTAPTIFRKRKRTHTGSESTQNVQTTPVASASIHSIAHARPHDSTLLNTLYHPSRKFLRQGYENRDPFLV